MIRLFAVIFAVLVNCMMGGTLAAMVGVDPLAGAVGLNVVAATIGNVAPAGSLRAGVYTEIWTGELVKNLRRGLEATFLDGIPDSSSIVNNDVIHLVEVGVDPDVLINNTTYPIPLQALDDEDIAIQLDKFQTKVTPVTDDELYAISYDKMSRVKESHSNAINDSKFTKAAHSLCAQRNTDTTPVLKTTGARDEVTGRLKLQYNINRNDGTVGRLYGFNIYEYGNNPLYTTAGEKKSVDATADAGEFQCSFAFYVPRVFKATGSTKMYYREATTDPEHQRNLINFRHYFVCMPKKSDAGGVLMSDYMLEG